jgi:hypothetical protein
LAFDVGSWDVLIVNDTQTLSRKEIHAPTPDTGTAAVTIASASLTVTRPDGTLLSPSPTVRWSPATSGAEHVFIASLTPSQGGAYRTIWGYSQSDGQTFDRPVEYFASWTDVGGLIRRRLRETRESLPDREIEQEIAFMTRTLVDRFVLLQNAGGYSGLVSLDQERFDQGMGLLVAAKLRRTRRKQTPVGELAEVKLSQGSEFRFGTPGVATKTLEQEWIDEAMLALGRVTVIEQSYGSLASSFLPFQVSGPTRNSKSQGNTETLLSGVIRLLTDCWALTPDNDDQNY